MAIHARTLETHTSTSTSIQVLRKVHASTSVFTQACGMHSISLFPDARALYMLMVKTPGRPFPLSISLPFDPISSILIATPFPSYPILRYRPSHIFSRIRSALGSSATHQLPLSDNAPKKQRMPQLHVLSSYLILFIHCIPLPPIMTLSLFNVMKEPLCIMTRVMSL